MQSQIGSPIGKNYLLLELVLRVSLFILWVFRTLKVVSQYLAGRKATANQNYGGYYYNENRQIVLIGQHGNIPAKHIIFHGFEVSGTESNQPYINNKGKEWYYAQNVSGVRVSEGEHVTISNCDIHSNERGIFTGKSKNIIIEHCYIHDNGVSKGSRFNHNLYLAGGKNSSAIVQYCHIGELLCDGQQTKFRTESLTFRYNWVEGGKNSVIDMVESEENSVSDAYVYGNVLIKPEKVHNSRMIHFGGDNKDVPRSGTLYFFNNTCIIKAADKDVRVFSITEPNCFAVINNNIFYSTTNRKHYLYNKEKYAHLKGKGNWFNKPSWLKTNMDDADLLSESIFGKEPGFANQAKGDYHLVKNAQAKDAVSNFRFPAGYPLDRQYFKPLTYVLRDDTGKLDIGAFAWQLGKKPYDFKQILP